MSMLFTIVVVGIVASGTLILRSSRITNRVIVATNYQAVMTARSGLTEAMSWLRRQTSQPVLAFEPALDPTATPAVLDTQDPDIGLVREFSISGNLWARYEVWKAWPTDPDPDRLAWRQQYQIEDISRPRTGGANGSVWRLRSVGYVFLQMDPNVPFNVAPNAVLATEMAETEVARAVINLPGQAAINVGDGNSCHINTNSRVVGGALAGIYFPQNTGTPTIGPRNQNRVTGTPALSAGTTYNDSYEAVFGMSFTDLTAIADLVITNAVDIPSPLPTNSVIIIDVPNLNIDASNRLTGSGLVIIRGNVVMSPGNYSLFNGLLYVDGNLTVRSPSEINGSVVCTGNMTVQGNVDFATINYDEGALAAVLANFGSYRHSNALMLPRRK